MEKTLKVAHITPSFSPSTAYGGATDSESRLCHALHKAGAEVRVLTTNADGPHVLKGIALNQEVNRDGLKVRYCPRLKAESISLSLLTAIPEFIAWADVVHLMAVYSFPTLPALFWARMAGKPVVWSPRGALERWSGSRKKWGKSLWDMTAKVIAPKNLTLHMTSLQEEIKTRERWPRARTAVIPNGVEIPSLKPRSSPTPDLRLLFLGRLDPKKGIENLLAACARLQLSRPWTLTIAGSGEPGYEEALKARAEQLGVTPRVRFVGQVAGAKKKKIFLTHDLLVAPSYTENFCVAVAESLAHGVPVVASRGTPWGEVETRGCGVWVNNDPDSLRHAIEEVSDRPLAEMGAKGRAWMQSDFTWEEAARKMMGLYRRLVENA